MTPISRLGQLALILSLVTGCEERATIEDVIPPIPDDSYVEVMAELTRLRRRPPTARGQIERDRHGWILEYAESLVAAAARPSRQSQIGRAHV